MIAGVVIGSTGAPGTDPTAGIVGGTREATAGAPTTDAAGPGIATPAAPIPPVKL